MIGDLVQQGITQSDDSVTGTGIVLATIAPLTVGVSCLGFRVRPLRPLLLDGEPLVLVEDGQVIERHLARERIALDDLMAQRAPAESRDALRRPLGILETNGQVSFISKGS